MEHNAEKNKQPSNQINVKKVNIRKQIETRPTKVENKIEQTSQKNGIWAH